MYSKITSKTQHLEPHHHIRVDQELRTDCAMWLAFLDLDSVTRFCRPFIDLKKIVVASDVNLYSDSSANQNLGFGGVYNNAEFFFGQWEKHYIEQYQPSIEYLELYAVCVGLFIWMENFTNRRILIHCDNMSVVNIINKTTSSCRNCMSLVQLLVSLSLRYNTRVFAQHIFGKNNNLSDSLSRLRFTRFWKLAPPTMQDSPRKLPDCLWPASKIWNQNFIKF